MRQMTASMLLSLLTVCSTSVAEEPAEHEFHRNKASVFAGVALEDRRDNGLALGLEYERRLNESIGIGAIAEYTFGDFDTLVIAVPVGYHWGRWLFFGGPGVEDSDHDTEFLVRFGIEYSFEVGDFELSPQFNLDLVDGDAVVIPGLTFGRAF